MRIIGILVTIGLILSPLTASVANTDPIASNEFSIDPDPGMDGSLTTLDLRSSLFDGNGSVYITDGLGNKIGTSRIEILPYVLSGGYFIVRDSKIPLRDVFMTRLPNLKIERVNPVPPVGIGLRCPNSIPGIPNTNRGQNFSCILLFGPNNLINPQPKVKQGTKLRFITQVNTDGNWKDFKTFDALWPDPSGRQWQVEIPRTDSEYLKFRVVTNYKGKVISSSVLDWRRISPTDKPLVFDTQKLAYEFVKKAIALDKRQYPKSGVLANEWNALNTYFDESRNTFCWNLLRRWMNVPNSTTYIWQAQWQDYYKGCSRYLLEVKKKNKR